MRGGDFFIDTTLPISVYPKLRPTTLLSFSLLFQLWSHLSLPFSLSFYPYCLLMKSKSVVPAAVCTALSVPDNHYKKSISCLANCQCDLPPADSCKPQFWSVVSCCHSYHQL